MNVANDTHSLAAPRLRRHWKVVAAVTAFCVGLVILITLLRPPIYTAEARLAVGSGQMTALNIPGYPTASERLASNYARWVDHQSVQGYLTPEGTLSLSASPIVESNVLRIEATSHDSAIALRAAKEATDALKEAVNQVASINDRDALLAEITENVGPLIEVRQVADRAEATHRAAVVAGAPAAEERRLFAARVEAAQRLAVLELEQNARRDRYRNLFSTQTTEADLVDVLPAHIVGTDRVATLQRNGLLALLAGVMIGSVFVLLPERLRQRLRVRRRQPRRPIEAHS